MNKFLLLLKSRKFWALLIGFGVFVGNHFGQEPVIPEDQMVEFVTLLAVYIVGTALEDGLSRR
jgi:hypothetical protein